MNKSMVRRKARMTVSKSGRGTNTFRATIPQTWAKHLGLNEDFRNMVLELKEDHVRIYRDNSIETST